MNLESLIRHLKQNGVLQTPRVEDALRVVDRKYFVPEELQGEAYEDYPLPIGYDATISQPTTVAFILEKLDVREGQTVLDIGSGSGWTTALLAHLVGAKGRVTGLEIVPELVALGEANLRKCHSYIPTNVRMRMANAEIRQARQGVVGLPSEGPYDRILVSAAGKEVPSELTDQLHASGRMVMPVETEQGMQSIFVITKSKNGTLDSEEFPGFAFVPLQS